MKKDGFNINLKIPVLFLIFVFNQLIAPLLDKLDRNKYLETAGYWAEAKKIEGD